MSTRCQIGVYTSDKARLEHFESLMYRHSDGYPEAVLPDVMPFLSWWAQGRGIDDTEYVAARLLQYLCNMYDKQGLETSERLSKGSLGSARLTEEMKETKKWTGTLGHGICKVFHWDIEYFYAICPAGLQVYEVTGMSKEGDMASKTKLLGVIPYQNYEQSDDYKKLLKADEEESDSL